MNTTYEMTVYISFFFDGPLKGSCPMSKEGERHKWGISAVTQVRKTTCKAKERETALSLNPSQGE